MTVLNFVSFMECVNAPSSACLTSLGILVPIILALLFALVGAAIAYKNRSRFRIYRSRFLWTSMFLIASSLGTIGYIMAFSPETAKGVSTSTMTDTAWATALVLYGIGLSLLICVGGFALGGWLVKRKRGAKS